VLAHQYAISERRIIGIEKWDVLTASSTNTATAWPKTFVREVIKITRWVRVDKGKRE
jgi:hypothetical protein